MRPAILTLLLALPAATAAPPELKLPEKVAVESGDWVVVTAETDGKAVEFVPLDPGLKRFPAELIANPKVFAATAARDGTYRVLAYTGGIDGPSKPKVCVVTVGKPAPVPPPTPPPVPPADPLRQKLLDAYAAETAAGKAEARKDLAELYRQAAALAKDPALKTAGELNARVRKAAEALAPGVLAGVRRVAGEELGRVLPTDPAAELTPAHRSAAADVFGRLAAILDSF